MLAERPVHTHSEAVLYCIIQSIVARKKVQSKHDGKKKVQGGNKVMRICRAIGNKKVHSKTKRVVRRF